MTPSDMNRLRRAAKEARDAAAYRDPKAPPIPREEMSPAQLHAANAIITEKIALHTPPRREAEATAPPRRARRGRTRFDGWSQAELRAEADRLLAQIIASHERMERRQAIREIMAHARVCDPNGEFARTLLGFLAEQHPEDDAA
jgi:hypothetical protein